MALTVDGTEITNKFTIKFNGTSLTKIVCDGVTVWEKIPATSESVEITAFVYGRMIDHTYSVTKTEVTLSKALPKALYFTCNAYLNGQWKKRVLTSSVTAGKTSSVNEQHQSYSDPPNFTLASGDRLKFTYLFYTNVDGEEVRADIGTTYNELTVGTIYYDSNVSYVFDNAYATVWCAT